MRLSYIFSSYKTTVCVMQYLYSPSILQISLLLLAVNVTLTLHDNSVQTSACVAWELQLSDQPKFTPSVF
jgi:hypothetical protein